MSGVWVWHQGGQRSIRRLGSGMRTSMTRLKPNRTASRNSWHASQKKIRSGARKGIEE